MSAGNIAIAVIGVLVGGIVATTAWAIAREPGPLRGAALDATPAAKAYAEGVARVLSARWPAVRELDFRIREPDMRVRGFEIEGADPPLLLIHGGGSSAIQWVPLLEQLRGRHLIAVDRPGCGLSDGFDYTGVDLRRHGGAFVGSVIEALKLDQPVLIGNSMGGLWSITFALEHPERVAGVILDGTPAVTFGTGVPKPLRMLATPGLGQLMGLRQADEATLRERLVGLLGRRAMDRIPADVFEVAWRGSTIPGASCSFRTLARTVCAGGVSPSSDELAKLAPPLLVVWGDADIFADPGFPQRVRQTAPRAQLVVLSGAGHCPELDDPQAVGRAIGTFVDGLGRVPVAASAR
jgi:2-hydroxy-6-oxonona-2,4-dienedioate hydrolase